MRAPARVAGIALAFATLIWLPAFLAPRATGFGDWQMIHHNLEAALAAIRAGDLPLWDPFHCGGVTSWGNPESQHFAPWVLLAALALGSTLATKVLLVAHTALGAAGAFRYARLRHGLGPAASALVGGAWAASGFFSWQMAGGHFTFAPYYLFPWLLLAWRRSLEELRAVPAVVVLLVAIVLEGGTYPFPHALLALALDTLIALAGRPGQEPRAVTRPRSSTVAWNGAIAVGLVVLLTAVRWLPIAETLTRFPRTVTSTDAPAAMDLMKAWVLSESEWRAPGRLYVWPEYCAYLGWPVVGLAAVGTVRALRAHRTALVGLAIFFVLAMGAFHPWAPWSLLHRLPLYDSLRVPSRLQVLLTFYVALLAGIGLDAINRGATRALGQCDWWEGTAWGIVVFALAPLVVFNLGNNDRWDGAPVESAGPAAPRFHLEATPDYHARYALLPRQNKGTRSCYVGAMDWDVAPGLWNGDRPQARVADGELRGVWRTPNHIHLDVSLPEPGRVLLDQNHDPDWQATTGTLTDERGLLALDLPGGDHSVTVSYRPWTLPWAAGSFVLGLVGLLALAWRTRRTAGPVLSGRLP